MGYVQTPKCLRLYRWGRMKTNTQCVQRGARLPRLYLTKMDCVWENVFVYLPYMQTFRSITTSNLCQHLPMGPTWN